MAHIKIKEIWHFIRDILSLIAMLINKKKRNAFIEEMEDKKELETLEKSEDYTWHTIHDPFR